MSELNGEITNFDLLVSCKDEQYQKLSIQMAGNARWQRSKKMTQEIQDFWKENMKHLIKPVARKITEHDLLKDAVADEIDSRGDVDFDDVFDD